MTATECVHERATPEEEKLLGCLRSFFRARHQKVPAYRTGRKRGQLVSKHRRYCQLARHYIAQLRELRGTR